ncbi:MAG: transposase [Candidatus Promineofilum sp.]|nr:transposase [Promineifilum sp.]
MRWIINQPWRCKRNGGGTHENSKSRQSGSLKQKKTIAGVAFDLGLHPNTLYRWRRGAGGRSNA